MTTTIIARKTDGKVVMDKDIEYVFSTLKNGAYHITIKRASEKRSINQNSLLWMWLSLMERETGTPKTEFYKFYKQKFLSRSVQIGNRIENDCTDDPKELTKERFTDFLRKVQADAAQEFGIQLPVPEDRFFENFYQQFNY